MLNYLLGQRETEEDQWFKYREQCLLRGSKMDQ